MKYALKSILALAITWVAVSPQFAAALAVAIVIHAIYRSTAAGRLARLARLDSKIAARLAEAGDYERTAVEIKDALERFLDRFVDRTPITREDKATAESYHLEIATNQQDAKESEAVADRLRDEARRLRNSLTPRYRDPVDGPLF